MAYTSHGHQIRGTAVTYPQPLKVMRCGGPGLCNQCSREAAVEQSQRENLTGKGQASTPSYQEMARQMVYGYASAHLHRSDLEGRTPFALDDVFVVWFCKTLRNWKCLLSTTLLDGMYYEVTFDGEKQQAYLDAYKKFDSQVIPVG
jgi:hypothetical protein